MVWRIRLLNMSDYRADETLNELLEDRWEPYAVVEKDNGWRTEVHHWLRKNEDADRVKDALALLDLLKLSQELERS